MYNELIKDGYILVPDELVELGLYETWYEKQSHTRVFSTPLDNAGMRVELRLDGSKIVYGQYDGEFWPVSIKVMPSYASAIQHIKEYQRRYKNNLKLCVAAFGKDEHYSDNLPITQYLSWPDVCGDGTLDLSIHFALDHKTADALTWKREGPIMMMDTVFRSRSIMRLIVKVKNYIDSINVANSLIEETFSGKE